MSDLIQAVKTKADMIRVRVVTRMHEMEGDLHCPRVGKQSRNLSQLLNAGNRAFLALTNVRIFNGEDWQAIEHDFVEVNVSAIEFLYPRHPSEDAETGLDLELNDDAEDEQVSSL